MNLKAARLKAQLTHKELATSVGLKSSNHIYMLETGRRTPRLPLAKKLKKRLPDLDIETFDGSYQTYWIC